MLAERVYPEICFGPYLILADIRRPTVQGGETQTLRSGDLPKITRPGTEPVSV